MNTNGQSYQHTIKKEISIAGAGIHTGQSVTMHIKPAEPNSGITFQRTDLPGKPTVKADVDYVVETNRSTTLEHNGARVSTVEHLMAALFGMQVDNALVEIDGEEVPILDGSAEPFVEAIEAAGLQQQDAEKIYYTIDHNITFSDEDKKVEMVALPYHEYRINTLIDFNSPVLGTQHASIKNLADFNTQIASCRTFCFFHELEWLLANNLIKGGDINNAIVVVDKEVSQDQVERISKVFHKKDVQISSEGILNNLELRFPNEPARHKLLGCHRRSCISGLSIQSPYNSQQAGSCKQCKICQKDKRSHKET